MAQIGLQVTAAREQRVPRQSCNVGLGGTREGTIGSPVRLLRFTKNFAPRYTIIAVLSVAVILASAAVALASVAVVLSSAAVALPGITGAFVIDKAADTVVHTVRPGREDEEALAQVRPRVASSVCAPTRILRPGRFATMPAMMRLSCDVGSNLITIWWQPGRNRVTPPRGRRGKKGTVDGRRDDGTCGGAHSWCARVRLSVGAGGNVGRRRGDGPDKRRNRHI